MESTIACLPFPGPGRNTLTPVQSNFFINSLFNTSSFTMYDAGMAPCKATKGGCSICFICSIT